MAPVQFQFEAIGTHWVIDILDASLSFDISKLEDQIKRRIDQFDAHYSRFREGSLINQISQQPGEYAMPDDFDPLINHYQQLYTVTKGLVTPLIGQVMVDAGYDSKYSLQPKEVTAPPSWESAINYQNNQLSLQKPVLLDFGAAGKGYLIDIIAGVINQAGFKSFVIDAGGDIRYQNQLPETLTVGLENPLATDQVIGIVNIPNKSICASAGNRRKWQNWHHIVNPQTLTPVNDILATWVIADTTLLADGIATALFFVQPDQLTQFDFEYLIMYPDMTVQQSENFGAELFTN